MRYKLNFVGEAPHMREVCAAWEARRAGTLGAEGAQAPDSGGSLCGRLLWEARYCLEQCAARAGGAAAAEDGEAALEASLRVAAAEMEAASALS